VLISNPGEDRAWPVFTATELTGFWLQTSEAYPALLFCPATA
jgi:hypothetical protein